MKAYRKQEIGKRIGRSVSVVQSWTDQKIVLPEVIPSQGRGIARVYSEKNLLEFAFVNVLVRLRLRLDTIRAIMEHIRQSETVKDFFTCERWGEEYQLYFSTDNRETPDVHMFRVVKKGTSSPAAEMIDKSKSPAVIFVQLDKVLAEAKRRLGEK